MEVFERDFTNKHGLIQGGARREGGGYVCITILTKKDKVKYLSFNFNCLVKVGITIRKRRKISNDQKVHEKYFLSHRHNFIISNNQKVYFNHTILGNVFFRSILSEAD